MEDTSGIVNKTTCLSCHKSSGRFVLEEVTDMRRKTKKLANTTTRISNIHYTTNQPKQSTLSRTITQWRIVSKEYKRPSISEHYPTYTTLSLTDEGLMSNV